MSRWLVRKADGTELRFPSLDALKAYILSGVVTSGDVVAPEDASWARVEDLAELASLMGMIAPPTKAAEEVKRPATRPNLRFGAALEKMADAQQVSEEPASDEEAAFVQREPTTRPPPLPRDEVGAYDSDELDDPKTVYSGPPSFDLDPPSRDPRLERAEVGAMGLTIDEAERGGALEPLSREIRAQSSPSPQEPLPELSRDEEAELLSRPVNQASSGPQTHEVMSLNLKRAQRRRIIIGSIVMGMLVAAAIFFAVRNIQEASTPPDEKETLTQSDTANEASDKTVASAAEALPEARDAEVTKEQRAPEAKADNAPLKAQAPETQEAPQASDSPPPAPANAVDAQETPLPKGAKEAKDKATQKADTPAKKRPKPTNKVKSAAKEDAKGEAMPQNIDGLMSRAKRVRKKNPAQALAMYKRVLEKNPNHSDAMQLASRAYLQLGRTSEAIALLKVCRNKRPRFSPCLYYLGRAFERAGNSQNAKKAYKKLVDEFPESSLSIKARKKLGD